jgi:hypothetical protein
MVTAIKAAEAFYVRTVKAKTSFQLADYLYLKSNLQKFHHNNFNIDEYCLQGAFRDRQVY